MHFTCTQDNLIKGISQVAPIAGRNTQLPILQHILLQVRDNILHLTATDLEIGVHTIIGGKAQSDGSCTVPARRFFEYIQQLPNTNPVTIERKGTGVLVTTKGFRATFLSSEAEDFPLLPDVQEKEVVEFEPTLFCQALTDTLFAASKEDIRPEIRSVLVSAISSELRVAATDSFRLAEKVIPLQSPKEFQFVLPLSSAQEVARLFAGQEELHVLPHTNHVAFQSDTVELTSRLLDGQYPDYRQIIPRSSQTKVRVDREELLRALKTVSVFLPRDSRRVQVEVDTKKQSLHVVVSGSEAGEGDVDVSLLEVQGEPITMLLNIQYLLEGIQHISTKTCDLFLNSSEDPVVVRPDAKDKDYVYLVMPIQV